MNLIDTHAHLTYEGLIERIDAVLARSVEAGVTRWITVGTKVDDNEKALHLASEHENMVAVLGYHPHEADDVSRMRIWQLLAKSSFITPKSSLSARPGWIIITCTHRKKISSASSGGI